MAENYQDGNGYEDDSESHPLEEAFRGGAGAGAGAERNGPLIPVLNPHPQLLEDSPVVIIDLDAIWKHVSVSEQQDLVPAPSQRDGKHLSFKLPRDSIDFAFIESEEQGHLLIPAEKVSRMINFRLEDGVRNHILTMDEDAQRQVKSIFYHLSERLEEWKIKKVYRGEKSNKIDSFYHNKASNKWFRSFVEVQNFIIYHKFPKPQNNKPLGELSSKLSAPKRKSDVEGSSSKLKFKIIRDKGGRYRIAKPSNSDEEEEKIINVVCKSNVPEFKFKIVKVKEGHHRIVPL